MTQTTTALTREQALALKSGNNLDLVVAIEVMGHEPGEFRDDWIKLGPKFEGCPKRYSSDMSKAWEVEKKIKELRLQAKYCEALKRVVIGTGEYVGMFDFIHATPAQRCKAALLAVLDL
ncbi:hypothetical protein Q0V21_19525 [Paenibacillus sp. 11B]|uniref:BC1872 family protein n=1 Tax=Bacillales TaxID=1385 RepID=UPI00264C67DB|nr:hypothetical protein [Paenibacillus sp. 11B]MDN8590953.1 hypothetical protein [Paenibacillus sp. 11B]